ncbi:hypothetical protein H6F88_16375 [Oculatella sp. FACHB-28]|uniref:hypothetical protein n=1 Tax=Cyanophyceae TaxID=3028117 RepID=UPI001688D336|nr:MULTISPECIES: hypothetical protein [Cyanophyceae]MBD1999057.1 hypothetical protein [Leptolyngbya sp. FACHB-541]MBD2057575.1 hypothetical protein [Oculatella sp. FACHB-28]MBD2070132.1 hypothetical protein [Leptolyngbya sp. FACHB-671]
MVIDRESVEKPPEVIDPPKSLPTADFYQLIHEQISNEDDSMNQRVNWLIISQSFFFSGFATLLSSPPKPENDGYADLHDLLLWIIPGISLITSLLIYVGILTSLVYMASLRKSFQTYPSDNTTEHFPPIQGTTTTRRLAQMPAVVVPLLFICTWIVLLVQELR